MQKTHSPQLFSPQLFSTRLFSLLLFSLLLLLCAFPLVAEAPPDTAGGEGDAEGIFLETIDVNVVNVEVYVTDKEGNPITDLTKDDFTLEVGKKPMPISNFYAVEDGRVTTPLEIETLDVPEEPLDPRLPPKQPIPDEQKLHLIVYVDNLNLRPFNRNRVLGAARGFLRQNVKNGDEVMLVTYERSLKVRHPFTSDPEIIASMLYEIEEISALGVHADSDRDEILDLITNYEETGSNRSGPDFTGIRSRAMTYAENLYNDMQFTLDALREIVDSLAGLPGRKAILYVSDGLPLRPAEDIFHAMDSAFQEAHTLIEIHRFDLTRDFTQLTSAANANRVTFYTVDSAGLRTYTYMDASKRNAMQNGAFIDQTHFSNLQSSIILMAQETGGRVIMNTNNIAPGLAKVGQDFVNYYSLGFSTGDTVSGRYHRIKIKLKDKPKGWKVRYRDGFREKPINTRMADSTLAALTYGYQKNDLGIVLELGQPQRQDTRRARYVVPLSVIIPLGKLAYLPQENVHRGRIRLFVAAQDNEGGMSDVQDVEIPIDIPAADYETAMQQIYRYDLSLQMRGGKQIVAVGVRDEIGSETGFVTRGMSLGGGR